MIYFVTNQLQLFNNFDIKCITSLDSLLERFKDTSILAVDSETNSLKAHGGKMLSLQIGDWKDQYVIDVQNIDIKVLKEFLEGKTLIFQNAKFDLQFLFKYEIYPRIIIDTYLQEEVLNMGRKGIRKGLDALSYRYLKITLSKEIRGKIHKVGLTPEVIKYAADDVKYLHEINYKQQKRLKEDNLLIAARLENKFVFALAYTEYCGIYLNKKKWQKKQEKDNKNLINSINILNKWIIENLPNSHWIEPQLDLFSSEIKVRINWNSSKQVVILFKELGINTDTKDGKTGEPTNSVEASILKPQEKDFEIIKPYLDYKGYYKVVSTYGDNFINQINPITGRIHTSFRQLMSTGRLSSGNKKENTPNLQNIPADKETRSCFTNQCPNNVLVNCDYQGQESILLTNISKDENLIEFYQKGMGDLHAFVASKIFPELAELALVEIKNNHAQKRQVAKSANFALSYGGNGNTIARNLSIPVEEGDKVYKDYFDAFPGLKSWFAIKQANTLSNGYILINTLTNRRFYLPFFNEFKILEETINKKTFWPTYREHKQRNSTQFNDYYKPLVKKYFKFKGDAERKAQNFPIQGTGAETMKIAIIKFMDWILNNNLFGKVLISNQIHDEALVECPKEIAEIVSVNLKRCMEEAGELYCKIIPLKADPKISLTWQH